MTESDLRQSPLSREEYDRILREAAVERDRARGRLLAMAFMLPVVAARAAGRLLINRIFASKIMRELGPR